MTRAAALGGGAHRDLIHIEAGVAQPFGKSRMRPRGPDREHAAPLQRPMDRLQSPGIIKRVVGLADQAFRAVVDIEQDGVERRRFRCNHLDDIGAQDARARVVEAVAEDSGHRPLRPGDHGGHQLGHRDPRFRPQHREGCAQREAHAQPADQQMRRLDGFQPSAGQRRQRLLRSGEAAAHQLVLSEFHGKFDAALHQAEFEVGAGHACRIDLFPWNHPGLLRRFGGLVQSPLWADRTGPGLLARRGRGTRRGRDLVGRWTFGSIDDRRDTPAIGRSRRQP